MKSLERLKKEIQATWGKYDDLTKELQSRCPHDHLKGRCGGMENYGCGFREYSYGWVQCKDCLLFANEDRNPELYRELMKQMRTQVQ